MAEGKSPVTRKGSKVGSVGHVARRAKQSIASTIRLYSRASIIWSQRPQRGAGTARDYRPRGVSRGPLDEDT